MIDASSLGIGPRDLIDVALVAVLLFAGIVWLRRTRARLALLGIGIIGAIYLIANRLQLELTASLLQGFFAVLVIVVVVVFQEDLRRLFEQIAVWGLRRRPAPPARGTEDTLVRAAARLASTRTGALIVIAGREPLERHVDGGVELDGRVSEPLLLSLFDPHSPGHDGAVLVERGRISRFAVHLPLSTDHGQLGATGTRHAAALGLAERSDALCIVVSEERGTVSVAREGRLRALRSPESLAAVMREYAGEPAQERAARTAWRSLLGHWREALLALAAAVGLWFVQVPGAGLVEVERPVEVVLENVPPGYVVDGIDPRQVVVTLAGPWRSLYFADPGAFRVRLDAFLLQLGRRTFRVTPDDVQHPDGTEVVSLEPERIRVSASAPSESSQEKP